MYPINIGRRWVSYDFSLKKHKNLCKSQQSWGLWGRILSSNYTLLCLARNNRITPRLCQYLLFSSWDSFQMYLFLIEKNYSFFFLVRILMKRYVRSKLFFFVKNHSSNFLHCVVFILFLLVGIWETNMYEITNRMYHKKLSRYCTLQFPKGHSVRMVRYWRRFCPVI